MDNPRPSRASLRDAPDTPASPDGGQRMPFFITRREALAALGSGFSARGLSGSSALAQQRFFRIGTGGTGGTYYPVGGMIANAVSTDKINVSAVATNGSVANVNGIVGGSMESGFSQADI